MRVAVMQADLVVSCSPAARDGGVAPGLRRREAEGRCAGLVLVEHDPLRDARAFEPIAAAVEEMVPAIEILRPGALAFGVRGPARYYGGERALLDTVAG